MTSFSDNTFKEMIDSCNYSVVLMDEHRNILFLNKAGKEETGWREGESVPYCSFCQKREITSKSKKCLLMDQKIATFFSEMPIYSANNQLFEMSVSELTLNKKKKYLLTMKRIEKDSNSIIEKYSKIINSEVINSKEAERRKLAKELHDNIGQNMYGLYLGLELIKEKINDEEMVIQLEKLLRLSEHTMKNIKFMNQHLRPDIFFKSGLKEALILAKEEWAHLLHLDVKLIMKFYTEETFHRDKEMNLFRIIQEAVTNAFKYSKSNKLKIKLEQIDNQVFFQIISKGCFIEKLDTSIDGLGIKHMKERCELHNGELKIREDEKSNTIVEGYVTIQ